MISGSNGDLRPCTKVTKEGGEVFEEWSKSLPGNDSYYVHHENTKILAINIRKNTLDLIILHEDKNQIYEA